MALPLLDVCSTCLYLALPLLYLALPLLDVCSTCLYMAVPLLSLPLLLFHLALYLLYQAPPVLYLAQPALPGYLDTSGSTSPLPCFTLQYVSLSVTNSALPVSTFHPHVLYMSLPLLSLALTLFSITLPGSPWFFLCSTWLYLALPWLNVCSTCLYLALPLLYLALPQLDVCSTCLDVCSTCLWLYLCSLCL